MVQFAYLFLSLTYNELHRTGKNVSFPLIAGNMKKDNGAHPASEKKMNTRLTFKSERENKVK